MCIKHLLAVALVALLLTACRGAPEAMGAAVTDSVAFACTPVLAPGPDDEGVIADFAPGPDGLSAWLGGDGGQSLMIGRALDQAIVVGRHGEGPGEFEMIEKIGWVGDTVWVTDLMQPRVQYFDRHGALLGVRRLPPGGGWRPTPTGGFLAVGSKSISASGWGVLGVTGDSVLPASDTLFHFPGPTPVIVLVPMKNGGSLMTDDPLLAKATVASAPDGSRFCGSEPLEGDQVRIRCIDDHGTLDRDTVLTLAPVPLGAAVWDRMIDRFVKNGDGQRAAIEALFTRPASLPRVTALGVDRDGSLWIDRSYYGEAEQHWLRLAPDGALRDTLVLTRGYIAHLSGDTLWRNWSDADGMQSVERCVPRL